MPIESIVLPYTVLEKTRKKKFDENMEFSAITCLAEAKRKTHEKISFISKLHYPLWAIPWKKGCLIIDGMQILSTTFTYWTLPDLESFLKNIERGQTVRELFLNALDKHAETFASFSETIDIPMKAIVVDKVLLSDFSEYVEETTLLKTDSTEKTILLPPKLDKDAANKTAKKISELCEQMQSDIIG